jgi:hypothetical protein
MHCQWCFGNKSHDLFSCGNHSKSMLSHTEEHSSCSSNPILFSCMLVNLFKRTRSCHACDGPHHKSGNGIRSFSLNLIKYRLHKLCEISEHRDSSAAVELLHALLPTFGVILITYYPFHLLARLLPQVGDIRLLFVT